MFSLRTSKQLSSFLTVLAAVSSLAQTEDKKVSFETKAMTVPAALRGLSKACGKTLEAPTGFDNVPLILSVHDARLQDVMDKIADATVGKWTKTDNGYRLETDREAWKKLEAKALADRQAGLKATLDEYVSSHANDEKWTTERLNQLITEERASRQKLLDSLAQNNPNFANNQVMVNKGSSRAVTPATPALLEVLRRIPVSLLAKVGYGERVVLSSSPTPMQKPLPFQANGVLNKFVDAHNQLAAAVKGEGEGPKNVTITGGLDLNAKPLIGQLARMLVILSRRSNDSGVTVEVKFADANGTFVGSASRWLQPKSLTTTGPSALTIENDKPLDFSGLSLELARAFLTSQGNGNGNNRYSLRTSSGSFRIGSDSPTPAPALSNDALNALADPTSQDPQSTFVSDGLLGAANAAGKNLVACLPDSAIISLARSAASSPTATGFLKATKEGGAEVSEDNGWIVAIPADPFKTLPEQMNRAAAKRLYSDVVSKGYARLQQLSQFSQSLGTWPRTTNFGITTLKVIDPYVASALTEGLEDHPPLYQMLGTFDPQLFEGVSPESKLSVAGLTTTQKAYLERVVFGADGFGGIIGEGDFTSVSMTDNPSENLNRSLPGLADEPTEAMPNGLPLQGGVTLKFKPEEVVRAQIKNTRGGPFLTAAGLGGTLAFQSSTALPELASKFVTYDRFTEAVGCEVTLTREFVKGKTQDTSYSDAWLKPGSLPVLYDGLSPAFKDAVAKAKSEMGKSTIRIGSGNRPPTS